jgi:hypothetical protein
MGRFDHQQKFKETPIADAITREALEDRFPALRKKPFKQWPQTYRQMVVDVSEAATGRLITMRTASGNVDPPRKDKVQLVKELLVEHAIEGSGAFGSNFMPRKEYQYNRDLAAKKAGETAVIGEPEFPGAAAPTAPTRAAGVPFEVDTLDLTQPAPTTSATGTASRVVDLPDKLSPLDERALKFLKEHPDHPAAAGVRSRLIKSGVLPSGAPPKVVLP